MHIIYLILISKAISIAYYIVLNLNHLTVGGFNNIYNEFSWWKSSFIYVSQLYICWHLK